MTRQIAPDVIVKIVTPDGRQTQNFNDYLISVGRDPVYTLATLPIPEVALRIYVEDASGGGGLGVPCYGDGVNFRRYSDDTVVS